MRRTFIAGLLMVLACKSEPTETKSPAPGGGPPVADAKATDPKSADTAARRAQLAALPALPGVEAPRPVKFPEAQAQTLANGLELVVLEDHEVPRVRVMAIVRAGEIYSPAEQPSLAEFTAALLAEGTTRRDKATLDAQVDATGGSLDTFVDNELSGVVADVLARDAGFAFTAAAETILQPALPEAALKKHKDLLLQGIDQEKASPLGLGGRMAARLAYGENSAYARPFPTSAQVEGMTREQAAAFHARHYVPNNAMLVVAGDITPAAARKLADRAFGGWAKGADVEVPRHKRTTTPIARTIHIIDRKASAQASVLAVMPAPGIGERGWLQVRVLEQALGGGLSGRLNMVLREQLGLTYGAAAIHKFGYDGGAFYAGGSTKTSSAPEFLDALLRLLAEPGEDGVDAVELRRLLTKMSGQFALEAEGIDAITMKTIQQRTFGLPADFWARYRGDIESITAEDVKAASKGLSDADVQVVIVGRADKLVKALAGKGFGIDVYNTDLKLVEQGADRTASPR